MDGVSFEQLEALRRLDTCTVANAIERFDVRLRNEGFADGSIRCLFPNRPPVVGYAVTATIRCSTPPPVGYAYFDRTDWWNFLVEIPAPRIVVMQDVDERPGLGALVGEVHAHIFQALGCVAAVTNGGVRDLNSVEPTGFQLFAGNVSVSHAYVHIVDFGKPVVVGGLRVNPGDILHGDRNGFLSVPRSIASDIPSVAASIRFQEGNLIALCKSPDFSIEKLRAAVRRQ